MPRRAPELAVVLGRRPPGVTLADWLYGELRSAILDGRLARGARLPATRDLSARYGISRGVVIGAFEQLREEGYVTSRVGAGTVVRARVPEDYLAGARGDVRPPARPRGGHVVRPFCPVEPALA
ncbi:MAG TPA: winged helix-turn-helix domain-containing protein, partial [Polyangiaceae bacterium]|nr:winged helix-turn-helix domain-containing protein [Polyangiaceae bacterium]